MNYRELEILAAEKIMGWERTKNGFLNRLEGNGSFVNNYEWTPCTNIAQAFYLLSELCNESIPLDKRLFYTVGSKICELENMKGSVKIQEFGDSPSHAIVKACLAAKGYEVDEGADAV